MQKTHLDGQGKRRYFWSIKTQDGSKFEYRSRSSNRTKVRTILNKMGLNVANVRQARA